MEQEELLLEDYIKFEQNFKETYRNLVFIEDVYQQKLDEIEEELGKKVFDLKTSRFFEIYKPELESLDYKMQKCVIAKSFTGFFDVYKMLVSIEEIIKNDIINCNKYPLKNSFVGGKIDDVFLFNLAMLGTGKIQGSIIVDSIGRLMKNLRNLIEKKKEKAKK